MAITKEVLMNGVKPKYKVEPPPNAVIHHDEEYPYDCMCGSCCLQRALHPENLKTSLDDMNKEDWKDDVYQAAIQNPKPRPLMNDLMDYCAKWQKRLRLQDWKVYIRIARMRDMDDEKRAATISIKWYEKNAYITYLDPLDYVGCFAENPELTILHELCHIFTGSIPVDDNFNRMAEEIATIAFSEALYKMEYPDWKEDVSTYQEVNL
jgi:hypothetical protein